MTNLKQAGAAAIAAWERVHSLANYDTFYHRMDALRDALAAHKQAEPVQAEPSVAVQAEPVTEPVPLTVAEIEQMNAQWDYEIHGDRTRYLVRMTEKAHGIGEKE